MRIQARTFHCSLCNVARSGCAFLAALLTLAFSARALAAPDATGKGISGGALLGAELTIFGEAIAGLEAPWLYWLGAGVGAAGGGFGGYYVETSGAARSSYYLLASGMALSIPALIVYLDATNEARRSLPVIDSGPDYDEEPLDELDAPTARSRVMSTPIDSAVDRPSLWLMPTFSFEPVHDSFEVSELSAPRTTRVMVSLVRGVF